jgi:hypothetical protein
MPAGEIHRQLIVEDKRICNRTTMLKTKKNYKISLLTISDEGWVVWEDVKDSGLYWVRAKKELGSTQERGVRIQAWLSPDDKYERDTLYLIGVIKIFKGPGYKPRWFGYPWKEVDEKYLKWAQFKRVENEMNGNIPLVFPPKVEDPTNESEEIAEDVRQEF